MAAWLNVAGQALRPAARRSRTWNTRIGYACLYAFVAAWAAVAPQANLSLGERLRLSFDAVTGICMIVAATSGFRHQFAIVNDPVLNLRRYHRRLAAFSSNIATATQDLVPTIPFLLFLVAVEVVSPLELLGSVSKIFVIVVAACAITNVAAVIGIMLAISVVMFTRHLNYFETTIAVVFALHLGLKASVGWNAITSTLRFRQNLKDESLTMLHPIELAMIHRGRLRRPFAVAIIGLAVVNLTFIFMLVGGIPFPATMEQKLALALAFAGGAGLLFLDSSALTWRGALSGIRSDNVHGAFTKLFAVIIGIPWAAAWIFSAMHSGEAFTLNEGAAYFFMWFALGGSISWFARATAKDKLQRDLRRLLSEQ